MYKFYNANRLGIFTDDCVIRSISCATNKSWDQVYDELSDIAQYQGTLLDNREFVINYLDAHFTRVYPNGRTVGEIAGNNPKNTLLMTMRGHIVCSKNGVVYDTFDCRDRIVEYVWLVK